MIYKKCERCPSEALQGQRFCKGCKKIVLTELRDTGYLTFVPQRSGQSRTQDHKELTHETKYGTRQ